MCLHNYTQHNGCGHVAPSHTHPWTLCDGAVNRLNELRGPMTPPLSPQVMSAAPPKRSSSTRRFFSRSLSRSNTSASRRTIQGVPTPVSSNGSYTLAPIDCATLPDHQLVAVRCAQPEKSTRVSREMDVCKTCKEWLENMRSMIVRYDKTGSVRGTGAFEKFLKREGDAGGERDDDMTVPLDEFAPGYSLGARPRQAIIMGHPAGGLDGSGGLLALEKEMNARRGFH
jgi:hypothetical protein